MFGSTLRRLVAVGIVIALTRTTHAEDPPLPTAVNDALQAMAAAQRAGDLDRYAATLAEPVGSTFRLHADSATKVGEAKRQLAATLAAKFGPAGDGDPFAYAFDDAQLRDRLKQLVDIHIDNSAPSGSEFKLQVTTTVRLPDGTTRTLPQGFIAIEDGATWKVQDLAQAGHLAALKNGAETNWSIYRVLSTIATGVGAGKYASRDAATQAARTAYDQLTGANVPPPDGREEYLAAEKAFNAGDFKASLAQFKRSADLGWPHSAFMVALHYSDGLGVPSDVSASVEWLKRDIAKNDPTAENYLGSMLLEGEGVPKDTAEGLRLLRLSADQDNASAFVNLGRAYLFGMGVPKDFGAGMTWLQKAAALGNAQAAYFVKWQAAAPGNRMFRDDHQVQVYQQVSLIRANIMNVQLGGTDNNGVYHAADPQRAQAMRDQCDAMMREAELE